jgi:sulfate permease, SulP family
VRWLVVDAGAITDLDFTAARALIDLQMDLAGRGVVLALTRVSNSLRTDLDRQEVTGVLGHDRIFTSRKQCLATYQTAGAGQNQ